MAKQVVLFIDAQNMYRGARDAFFSGNDSHVLGQFDPLKLGQLIATRRPFGDDDGPRILKEVRVYTGRPDSTRDPKTYGAHRRQCASWESNGVTVKPRTLRYPGNWPQQKAEEKGVDVAWATDFVIMAVEDHYDVGIIASTDTDLRPALEYVLTRPNLCAEVVGWSGRVHKELRLPGRRVWCHRLTQADYNAVADHTDYNLKP